MQKWTWINIIFGIINRNKYEMIVTDVNWYKFQINLQENKKINKYIWQVCNIIDKSSGQNCFKNSQLRSSYSRNLEQRANSRFQFGSAILSIIHSRWCHVPYDLGLTRRHCSRKCSSPSKAFWSSSLFLRHKEYRNLWKQT